MRAAAQRHDVTLVAQPYSVRDIKDALAAEGLKLDRVVTVAGPRWLRGFEGRLGLGHLDYFIWQWRAWRVIRKLKTQVDVAHHVTYGNDWLPCALHFVDGLPVVWGPVGGSTRLPWQLVRYLSPRGIGFELVRAVLTRACQRLTAAVVRRQGCVVVAGNRDTAEYFARLGALVFLEPDVAIGPLLSQPANVDYNENGRRRAVYAGRLTAWKGPYLALAAMAKLPANWDLHMFGAGEEEAGLRRRAQALGIADRVRMLGRRPANDVHAAMAGADVLLHPSMHEHASYTVAEAVRAGCPVVCLDVGGPPLLIEGTTGVAVPPDSGAAQHLAQAMMGVRRHQPSDRWSADRLPDTVTAWFEAAVADPGRRSAD
jgi:glycosyltransferase involved in cell wall biosynthesis